MLHRVRAGMRQGFVKGLDAGGLSEMERRLVEQERGQVKERAARPHVYMRQQVGGAGGRGATTTGRVQCGHAGHMLEEGGREVLLGAAAAMALKGVGCKGLRSRVVRH